MSDRPKKQLSPIEHAESIVKAAFDHNARQHKSAMRALNRVLSLAETRGFNQAQDFLTAAREKSPKLKRLSQHLFEFVSAEEFSQLSLMDRR